MFSTSSCKNFKSKLSYKNNDRITLGGSYMIVMILGVLLVLIHASDALKCYSGSFVGSITPTTLQNNLTQVTVSASANVCYSYKVAMNGVLNVFGEMSSSECADYKSKGTPYFDVSCCTSSDLCNTGATSGAVNSIPIISSSVMMFIGVVIWCCLL